ncbi:hypothetical protein N7541_001634 [Penicillium brevicompactum]|uniref:Zn(2)-C6 fungal-type domain-containing protein n=1 Tax=Penicillium brevicompactum TaxID=5074 RepID=A0A9W9S189_PENBR|nr:hypothetical protein N7541_001634 [Penicillium brevicompactum]
MWGDSAGSPFAITSTEYEVPMLQALMIRQRSARACLACRQRKRKCDGELPCNTCVGYDYECSYDSVQGAPKRKRQSEEEIPSVPKVARILPEPQSRRQNASAPSGILDSTKSRFVGRYSSVAFPLCVGLELQAAKPPRLHSFAYHTGKRKEPESMVRLQLAERMSWNTIRGQLDYYFLTIHPVFGFLDESLIYKRCEKHWHKEPQSPDFEAIIAGLAALTCLFNSFTGPDEETWLALHAKEILEDPFVSRFPSVDQVAGWILRTIYLRSTTRPHVAWICSCTMMHLVEATGLHRAPQSLILATEKGLEVSTPKLSDSVQKTAWVAHCLHVVIAYEYGRSVINLGFPSQESLPRSTCATDFTPRLCRLIQAIPISPKASDSVATINELSDALRSLVEQFVPHDFLILVRADLAFSIYRRIRLLKSNLRESLLEEVISLGMSSLRAARDLVTLGQPWWNVISSVFQFVCVLLAIDTDASVTRLPKVMETLEMIVCALNTHLAKEALATARNLVQASLEKRRKGIKTLESIVGPASDTPVYSENQPEDNPEPAFAYHYPLEPSDLDLFSDMDFFN